MKNVVNPRVLIISTHLEESRSVTTESSGFGVEKGESVAHTTGPLWR